MSTQKKIAVLFPSFLGGGAEAVGVWILDALKDEYDLTLVTLTDNPLEKYDVFFGTHLAHSQIHVKCPFKGAFKTWPERFFLRINEVPALRQHLLLAYFHSLRESFDLSFSAYNEMDLGIRGIQYFHDTPGTRVGSPWLQKLFGYRLTQMKSNVSLAPSDWLARRFQDAYGIRSRVIHPPVRSEFMTEDWGLREDGFLCVARLSPEKRIESAIEVIAALRRNGIDTHLRIVTSGGKARYERSILRLCEQNGDWIRLERNLTNERYIKLLGRYRYFLNASNQEGFGIAMAEALNAGCIPFFLGTGGQQEVLESCPELGFSNPSVAAEKISLFIQNDALQAEALQALEPLRGRFSIELFRREIQQLVAEFLENDSPPETPANHSPE